jgi:hypothetical protein
MQSFRAALLVPVIAPGDFVELRKLGFGILILR